MLLHWRQGQIVLSLQCQIDKDVTTYVLSPHPPISLTLLQLVSGGLPTPDHTEGEVVNCCEGGPNDPVETLHSVTPFLIFRLSILHIPVTRQVREEREGKNRKTKYELGVGKEGNAYLFVCAKYQGAALINQPST